MEKKLGRRKKKRQEVMKNAAKARWELPAWIGSSFLGIAGAMGYIYGKVEQYIGVSPIALVGKEHSVMKNEGNVVVHLADGHKLSFINTTGDNVTIYPDAVTNQFPACNNQVKTNLPVTLSHAVGFKENGVPVYGAELVDTGAYGYTSTDTNTTSGVPVDQRVGIAVGGFSALRDMKGDQYDLPYGQDTLPVSPLRDLSGTMIHELAVHVCGGYTDKEGPDTARYQYLVGQNPPLIIPESLQPKLLYPEAILIAVALIAATRIGFDRILTHRIKHNK